MVNEYEPCNLTFNFLHRMLGQAQKGACELKNEAVQLHSAAFKLQNEVAALRADNAELKETSLKQEFEIQLSKAIIRKVSESSSKTKKIRLLRQLRMFL